MGLRQKLRDDKENKKFGIIILAIMVVSSIAMFFNVFIWLGCYALLLLYWAVHAYTHREAHERARENELALLVKELERKEIKLFIRDCFFNRGMSLKRVCEGLKEKYSIKLLISRGFKAGEFKSEELFERLYHILGFDTEEQYLEWESKNISKY